MNSQISSLQEQVDNLYANLNSLRATPGTAFLPSPQEPPGNRPSHERSLSISQQSGGTSTRLAPIHPRFRGPTSSTFSLDVANNTLNQMGYPNIIENNEDATGENTPLASPPIRSLALPPVPHRDPIWLINESEALRLCQLYEREIGVLYPYLDIEDMMSHARSVYQYVGSMKNGLTTEAHPEGVKDTKSCTLKLILACALMVETSGRSEIAVQLYDSVKPQADAVMHSESLDIRTLLLPTLMVC